MFRFSTKIIFSLFFLVLFGCAYSMPVEASEYAVAHTLTPVLNAPDFRGVFGGKSGGNLKTDLCGQVRELEYVAMPGTLFKVLKKIRSEPDEIYQIETDEYMTPANLSLYVDSRFLTLSETVPLPRILLLPSREQIISSLRSSVGSRYVWGGNTINGIPELAAWFYKNIREDNKATVTLAGFDCSGLLYYATSGWTPRNTSQLVTFGQGLDIADKRSDEITAMLKPLDLIVWNGHVVIVLDRLTTIESRLKCGKQGNGGVVITSLSQRISEIMRTRSPVNVWEKDKKLQNIFVVRRWYGQP